MTSNGPGTITPHGGVLVDRVLRGAQRAEVLARVPALRQVQVPSMAAADLELIGVGALSPLTGFMGEADYRRVVDDVRLSDGTVWSLPITLPVAREVGASIRPDEEIVLRGAHVLAIMRVREVFSYDKQHEARQVYHTTDAAHPGVARLLSQGDVLLGGDVWVLNKGTDHSHARLRLTPAEARRRFAERGWQRVVGFQTRSLFHRAQEYLTKAALETVDGLFLQAILAQTDRDELALTGEVRLRAYERVLHEYYPADRVLLGIFPALPRHAGSREAIFNAICCQNYGCSHVIVGGDDGTLTTSGASHDTATILDQLQPGGVSIRPIWLGHAFFCRACGGMASSKTCPHSEDSHIVVSDSEVGKMLRAGQSPPPEFTRPEVARLLIDGARREVAPPVERNGSHPAPARRNGHVPKLLVIGLDCAPPEYVFEQWRDRLPNLSRLMDGGIWGQLRSTVPPITVPAWACMLSGKDPGTLGVYGFRNRADHSYDKLVTANARSITEDRVWDVLSRAGRKVVTVGVPQTYPPRPVNGVMVSCFLTPSTDSVYTYPAELKNEIAAVVGDYVLDVHDFRTDDKQRILDQIWDMTAKRFALARHLLKTREWDFFMLHEIGPDRIHHSFWKHMDPLHPKHEPGNPYEQAIPEYYERLDAEIGRLLELAGDDTVTIVVSDHGAKRMDGGICLNEWLINEGYLRLSQQPPGIVPLERCTIDWEHTTAWGSGGYYGRLFLNVKGREPLGTIEPNDYERVRDEIAAKVGQITDHTGRNLGSRAYKPEEVYARVKGVPPDLILYFGDLAWRAVGSVGYGGAIHTSDNDTGPDDANHAEEGIFIMSRPPNGRHGQIDGLHLMDLAPTILQHFGLPIPADMQGAVIG